MLPAVIPQRNIICSATTSLIPIMGEDDAILSWYMELQYRHISPVESSTVFTCYCSTISDLDELISKLENVRSLWLDKINKKGV